MFLYLTYGDGSTVMGMAEDLLALQHKASGHLEDAISHSRALASAKGRCALWSARLPAGLVTKDPR